MIRRATTRMGIPAALVLAGGISRHGQHCPCAYCRPEAAPPATEHQAIPVIVTGGVR